MTVIISGDKHKAMAQDEYGILSICIKENQMIILYDYDASSRPIYVGWAEPGSATSDAVWRIKTIEYDASGLVVAIKWADGNTKFDNIWDGRAGLSYS